MAEGWARHLSIHSNLAPWSFSSAGLEAHGLNPNAVGVMAESGVDISAQISDTLERFDLKGSKLLSRFARIQVRNVPFCQPQLGGFIGRWRTLRNSLRNSLLIWLRPGFGPVEMT